MKTLQPSQKIRRAASMLVVLALLLLSFRAFAPLVFKPGGGWVQDRDPATMPASASGANLVSSSVAVEAVVNDRPILSSEVEREMAVAADLLTRVYTNNFRRQKLEQARSEALERLIERKLIFDEFQRSGMELEPKGLEIDLKEFVLQHYGDTNRFLAALAAQGVTLQESCARRAEYLAVNLMRQSKLEAVPPPTPEQIERFYATNASRFEMEEAVKVRLIVLNKADGSATPPAKTRAEQILAKLDEGQSFAELAKIHSDGSHRENGGDWGWVGKSTLRKELVVAAFSLKAGEHSGVIETPEAFYLILVEQKRPAYRKSLDEVRGEIKSTLFAQQRNAALKNWIDDLRTNAFIRYFGAAPQQRATNAIVRKIEMRHAGFIIPSNTEIRALVRSKEGEALLQGQVDNDVRALYSTGDFSNVRATWKEMDGGILLTYTVQDRPVLTDIKISGNKKLSTSELLKRLTSVTGERLDERKLFEDSTQIQTAYRQAGNPNTTVKYAVKIDDSTGRATVTFDVGEAVE